MTKETLQKDNAGLYALYVKQAIKHILTVDDCMIKLSNLSSLNVLDMRISMENAKKKMLKESHNREAQEFIKEDLLPFLSEEYKQLYTES